MVKYKVGDKVRFLNDGGYTSGFEKKYRKCYGIILKNDDISKKANIDIYNANGKSLNGFNIGFGYCFYYSEIEPYNKPVNPIHRFINAIVGWFCDPDSHSVNRYN